MPQSPHLSGKPATLSQGMCTCPSCSNNETDSYPHPATQPFGLAHSSLGHHVLASPDASLRRLQSPEQGSTVPSEPFGAQNPHLGFPGPFVPNSSGLPLQTGGVEFGTSVSSNGSVGTAGAGSGSLPEQKIFPGIVHERVRRSSILSQSAPEPEDAYSKKDDDSDYAGV